MSSIDLREINLNTDIKTVGQQVIQEITNAGYDKELKDVIKLFEKGNIDALEDGYNKLYDFAQKHNIAIKESSVGQILKIARQVEAMTKDSKKSRTAAVEPVIQQIGDIIKNNNLKLVDLRKHLETIFKKNDIDFNLSPVPHFRIKYKGKIIEIVNKKYADDIDLEVNDIAIGISK